MELNWKDQELYGLDYSTSYAKYKDLEFDIRYDCDTKDANVKPNKCGVWLTISIMNAKVTSYPLSSVMKAKQSAQSFLTGFLEEYR